MNFPCMGFRRRVARSLCNNSYKKEVLLESFITSIWCGANRFLHTEVTRADKALGEIFGWERTPAQDAYKRYFEKFTQPINQQVGHYFFSWFFSEFEQQ